MSIDALLISVYERPLMLFLYAVPFFLLGTLIVSIPVSLAAPHVSPRGIAFSKAVDESFVNLDERINGCWKAVKGVNDHLPYNLVRNSS